MLLNPGRLCVDFYNALSDRFISDKLSLADYFTGLLKSCDIQVEHMFLG